MDAKLIVNGQSVRHTSCCVCHVLPQLDLEELAAAVALYWQNVRNEKSYCPVLRKHSFFGAVTYVK